MYYLLDPLLKSGFFFLVLNKDQKQKLWSKQKSLYKLKIWQRFKIKLLVFF